MSITDLNLINADHFKGKVFDFCICGAGPAGITLARKLSEQHTVCLLEAGSTEYTTESQDFYKGTQTGKSYFPLDSCRLRYFGGSSGHWGGSCRPLDEEDFEKKPHIKYSGWPIRKADLDPYLAETKDILDINQADTLIPPDSKKDWLPHFPEFEHTRFWLSKPTRFGPKYREEIASNPNIECYFNANVTDIELSENLRQTRAYEVTSYSGKRFKIQADQFILATGGLENPRILLNANKQMAQGVGNRHDVVGRFFADHPHQHLAEYILEDEASELCRADELYWKGPPHNELLKGHFFKPTRSFQLENEELNYALSIRPLTIMPRANDSGFKSKLRNVICGSDYLRSTAEWLKEGTVSCHAADGVIQIQSEQEPNPDSRITLSSETDAFGMPRLNMHWVFTDNDRAAIKNAAYRTAERFAHSNTGRVRLERWLLVEPLDIPGADDGTASIVAGPHHMCTTRMSDDPHEGVVDRNCRIHGIENLYIAGSSVFSTGGFANPTFTIVQLSLRLADHLKSLQQPASLA